MIRSVTAIVKERYGKGMSDDALATLLDEREIVQCITRYARGVDRHDVGLIESAFHPDAIARHGLFVGNPHELSAWLNELHSAHTRGHQHSLSNFTFDIRGDVAVVETYVNFILWRKNDPFVDISGGRYADRFERRNGAWKIADRTVIVDWTAESPQGTDSKGTLVHYPWGAWDTSDLSYFPDR